MAVSGIVVSLIFTLTFADYQLFRDFIADDIVLTGRFSVMNYIFKLLILYFLYEVISFFRKNYNAEKHLEQIYSHRSDVLNSLHAVYTSVDNKDEKDKILSLGATYAYERGESGYITTKEGAGSSQNLIEGALGRFLK